MICLNETLYKIYVTRKSLDKFLKKKNLDCFWYSWCIWSLIIKIYKSVKSVDV